MVLTDQEADLFHKLQIERRGGGHRARYRRRRGAGGA